MAPRNGATISAVALKRGRATLRLGCLASILLVLITALMFLFMASGIFSAATAQDNCSAGTVTTGPVVAATALQQVGVSDHDRLVVMTAIAGSESGWSPDAVDAASGAAGLWKITKTEYPNGFPPAQPATWIADPRNNASAAVALAGGTGLADLTPWSADSAYTAFALAGGVTVTAGATTVHWNVAGTVQDAGGYFGQSRAAVDGLLGIKPSPSASASASASGTPDPSQMSCCGSTTGTGGGGGGGGGGASASQTANARMIVGIAKTMGMGTQGELIGLMVALDESGLQEYANSHVPLSLTYPHDAVGSDHGSVGIFQQQVNPDGSNFGWGTLDQLMNATDGTHYQAYRFFNALQRINGWQGMQPWIAAQAVQQSGDSTGMNYYAQLAQAHSLLNANADAPPVPLPAGASSSPGPSGAGGGGTCAGVDGYINPIKPGWFGPARTDMGVDWLPNAPDTPILAIGAGVITYSHQNGTGWPNWQCGTCGAYMTYKLTAGPKTGYCIYVAENLTALLPEGTTVQPGEQIALSQPGYAWTEWGWAKCAAAGQYGGPATPYNGAADGTPMPGGKAFARFLNELGAKCEMDPGPGPDVPY